MILKNYISREWFFLVVLSSLVMAYGWGYRGVTGSERGAMAAGAMLGLAVSLGSTREDWRRRSAIAGLFGAIGWCWGGSFSYMEQTFYTVSDSLPDVAFGYAALFLLGGLWAGIGGAVLGLAFTLPRSQLERLTWVFLGVSSAVLANFLASFFWPAIPEVIESISRSFPNSGGNWFTSLLVVLLCGVWSVVRPRERQEALLFIACALGWLVGFGLLTWLPGKVLPFPGTSLGPPYRLETWSGILGVLVVLMVWLVREKNRAAFMLSCYGILGGGLAFSIAVFLRHAVRVEWGIFAAMKGQMHWKIAEESFGLFMGLAIALGVARLARDGLAPAEEDLPSRTRLDVAAGLVILVGILWLNLRRTPIAWIERYEIFPREPVGGLMPWVWFTLGGAMLAGLVIYAIHLYGRGRFPLTPEGPYAKGALLLLVLMWVTAMSSLAQNIVERGEFLWVEGTFLVFCAATTAMLFSPYPASEPSPYTDNVSRGDARWKLGRGYVLMWFCVPLVLTGITVLSMAMQDGPVKGARKRFGADAYWREAAAVLGTWKVAGTTSEPGDAVAPALEAPFAQAEFRANGDVVVTGADGIVVADQHRWHHQDSYLWFDWLGQQRGNPDAKDIQMVFNDGKFYVPWPPRGERAYFIVLERIPGG